jgi:hypothetical protein
MLATENNSRPLDFDIKMLIEETPCQSKTASRSTLRAHGSNRKTSLYHLMGERNQGTLLTLLTIIIKSGSKSTPSIKIGQACTQSNKLKS